MPSTANTFSFYYTENTVTPNFNQLQPVPNIRDLQNVLIGNPNLKAALSHIINLNYRHVDVSNGSALQIGITGNATRNQVVNNTVLVRDTLNSLKQETHYENTNGNYKVNSNYFWSLPLDKNKYNILINGMLGYDHRVFFSDQVKNFYKGINFHQSAGLRINQKWLMLNTNVSYSYRNNSYSLPTAVPNVIQTWLFNADVKTFILSTLSAAVTAVKTVNAGYSLPGANTLLIGAYVEKVFLKNKQISVKAEVNDLLNQANNLNRIIADNSITESRQISSAGISC